MTIEDLSRSIQQMHREGWYHRRRGFSLREASLALASNHLIEEAVELQAELTLPGCTHGTRVGEAADLLAVYLHTLYLAGIPLEQVVDCTAAKLLENFTPHQDEVVTSTPGQTRLARET